MVTLRRFQQFIAVADELSFRRAAERLRMAQPPLTMAIQKLEEELGNRAVPAPRPTDRSDRGRRHVPGRGAPRGDPGRARVAVARSAHKGIIGNLRIGYTASTAYELMPLILKQYRAERPDVRLTLYEYPTWDQLDQLRAKHLDVGILRQPPSWPPGVRHKILARERLVALVPRQHRLAARRRIKLAELRDEPIVLFPPSWANRHHDRIVEACAAVGFVPRVVQEAGRHARRVQFRRLGGRHRLRAALAAQSSPGRSRLLRVRRRSRPALFRSRDRLARGAPAACRARLHRGRPARGQKLEHRRSVVDTGAVSTMSSEYIGRPATAKASVRPSSRRSTH
ncbi:MAG: LysR substrate-binding domain-containing protein, partial [Pseudomonadota bacterium]